MQKRHSQLGQSSMLIIGIAVVVIILGGVAFFLTQNKSKSTETQNTTETQAQPTSAEISPSMAMEEGSMDEESTEKANGTSEEATGKTVTIEVSGSNFKFVPNTITANQGDTVKIVFKSTGGIHDFVIDEFNVATKQVSSGGSEEVSFVASKKGTFEYYCSVGNHRQMGMKGTLTVK